MSTIKEILVPDIGDFKDVEIIEVLVKPGDKVAANDSLITLESDKAAMEIPSPYAGIVAELHVGVGTKVSMGTPILLLRENRRCSSHGTAFPGDYGDEARDRSAAARSQRPPRRQPARGDLGCYRRVRHQRVFAQQQIRGDQPADLWRAAGTGER